MAKNLKFMNGSASHFLSFVVTFSCFVLYKTHLYGTYSDPVARWIHDFEVVGSNLTEVFFSDINIKGIL